MGEATESVEIRVRYAETDQMGRAHHSHYLVWCELGRTAYMRRRGIAYAQLERDGLLLPVGRATLEYRRGVGYDHGESGDVIALASTELYCTNAAGRPMRIPADLRSALEAAAA
jgi:acyl-CoA thioesterase FadM